jgi:Ni,Fe-hydrogenase maturation factor
MIRVIGFGNTFHGDDGFGPAVARALLSRSWPAEVAMARTVPAFSVAAISSA